MLTKKVTHNRLRPKPSQKNKPKITQRERDYLNWLQGQSFSCMVCGTADGIEMHHVKEHSNNKKNHRKLLPLCYHHHRLSNDLSAHGTPTKFRELYPMEFQNELADKIYFLFASDN